MLSLSLSLRLYVQQQMHSTYLGSSICLYTSLTGSEYYSQLTAPIFFLKLSILPLSTATVLSISNTFNNIERNACMLDMLSRCRLYVINCFATIITRFTTAGSLIPPNITSFSVRLIPGLFLLMAHNKSFQNCRNIEQLKKRCGIVSTSPQLSQKGSSTTPRVKRNLLVGKYLCIILFCKLCSLVDVVTWNGNAYSLLQSEPKSTPSATHRTCAVGSRSGTKAWYSKHDLILLSGMSLPFSQTDFAETRSSAESGGLPDKRCLHLAGMAWHHPMYTSGLMQTPCRAEKVS